MGLTRISAKVALLIISLLPYITFILGWTVVGLDEITTNIFFVILGGLTFLSIPSLWIFYIINVYRNKGVANNQKSLWAILLFFGSFVAFPVYWYLHIWREPNRV